MRTGEALLTDTLRPRSAQLYLRPPSRNPIFHNSHTNSVFLHSRKRPAPVTDAIFSSRGWPLTRASTVLHSLVRSCGRQEEPAILISRLLLRMRNKSPHGELTIKFVLYCIVCVACILLAFVWTSTKNEWNAKNAI